MPQTANSRWQAGLTWALLSPVFLGIVPITAKIAYIYQVDVYTLAAFRTIFAAGLLWVGLALWSRHTIVSSVPAVLSSLLAGGINGIGSLFFYASLNRLDASLGQLINITYLIFVTILLRLIGQRVSRLTILRMVIAILAIYLLTSGGLKEPDWGGVFLMVIAALSYAVQLVFSQRIMQDIPASTMALYAITGMAAVVGFAWLVVWPPLSQIATAGWTAVLFMGLATALARLTLFLGVKNLGSMQTALLGVGEVIVTILLAFIFLGERLTFIQILGALLILISILLVRYERNVPSFDWWKAIYGKIIQRKYK